MFFLIFWTIYVPIGMLILSLVGEWLIHSSANSARTRGLPSSNGLIRRSDKPRNHPLHLADAIAFLQDPRRPHSRLRR